jgi:hypothetical protein
MEKFRKGPKKLRKMLKKIKLNRISKMLCSEIQEILLIQSIFKLEPPKL